jgi:hypothetical protein
MRTCFERSTGRGVATVGFERACPTWKRLLLDHDMICWVLLQRLVFLLGTKSPCVYYFIVTSIQDSEIENHKKMFQSNSYTLKVCGCMRWPSHFALFWSRCSRTCDEEKMGDPRESRPFSIGCSCSFVLSHSRDTVVGSAYAVGAHDSSSGPGASDSRYNAEDGSLNSEPMSSHLNSSPVKLTKVNSSTCTFFLSVSRAPVWFLHPITQFLVASTIVRCFCAGTMDTKMN